VPRGELQACVAAARLEAQLAALVLFGLAEEERERQVGAKRHGAVLHQRRVHVLPVPHAGAVARQPQRVHLARHGGVRNALCREIAAPTILATSAFAGSASIICSFSFVLREPLARGLEARDEGGAARDGQQGLVLGGRDDVGEGLQHDAHGAGTRARGRALRVPAAVPDLSPDG
jgi:hypothetical protein